MESTVVVEPVRKESREESSAGDINRCSQEWHLEYPHNKAFRALLYTSICRSMWEAPVKLAKSILHMRRMAPVHASVSNRPHSPRP